MALITASKRLMKAEQALVTSAVEKEAMFLFTEAFKEPRLLCGLLLTFFLSSDHN